MKKLLLLLLVALFGGFVYFIYFKGLIYWQFLPALAAVVALYYVVATVVTESMVRKVLGDEEFFITKGSIPSKDQKELIVGALVITKNDILFYKRKAALGGISLIYSANVNALETYTIDRVDDVHNGIIFHFNGDDEVKIGAHGMSKKENEMRHVLGWD